MAVRVTTVFILGMLLVIGSLQCASSDILNMDIEAPTPNPLAAKTKSAAPVKASGASTTKKSDSPKSTETAKSKASETSKTSTSQPAKPKSPTVTRALETQLSGFTSQDAEQLYARIALQETRKDRTWYIRGSLSRTETIGAKSSSHVLTSRVDSRLEHMLSHNRFSVWTGVLSGRDRAYSTKKRSNRSGYQFISYGRGKLLGPKARGDIGLGLLDVYDEPGGMEPTLMCSVRGRRPLTDSLTLESDTLVLQPIDEFSGTKLDAELALSHALSPDLSLRLGWTLNNLVRSVQTSREWDSGIRLSISYRHTTNK